jgi:hypothetical protein
LHCVNDDSFWELNCKFIFIDGNSLDVISTSNFDSGLRNHMLDDHICHKFSLGISVLIKSVNYVKLKFMKTQMPTVGSSKDFSLVRGELQNLG